MAEFAEVMRQAKRMCDNYGCGECPLYNGEVCQLGTDHDGDDYSDMERIIMAWAAEHPEQRYPTWNQWWEDNFWDASERIPPCKGYFMYLGDLREECRIPCEKCMDTPIPAGIAEKLGVKPITT